MFLQAQDNQLDLNFNLINLINIALASTYVVGLFVTEYLTEEDIAERPKGFWLYVILNSFGIIIYQNLAYLFLVIAYVDASRKQKLMKYMTSALQIELIDKDSETVRLPTIDFLDRKSL